MKVGFLFGSFDPIHIGHINIATQVLNERLVDNVVFILAQHNPWKEKQSSFIDRTTMLSLMLRDIPNVSFNNIECTIQPNEDGIVYTYQTIEKLKAQNPYYDYYIIVTQETYNEIKKWKNGERILDENKFIIVLSKHLGEITIEKQKKDSIIYIEHDIDISSTKIREMRKKRQILYPFVSLPVENFIINKGLYLN